MTEERTHTVFCGIFLFPFFPHSSATMDNPNVALLCLEQRDCSLESYTRDFLELAFQTHYPDRSLCMFYISSLSEWSKALLTGIAFAPIVCGVLGVLPHTLGLLIINIQHVEYLRFAIGVPLTFFRADSVTLNTPHTTGKSDKIIFRTTKLIGTLPRIVER